MIDDAQTNRSQVNPLTGAGATLLAAAGLAAGFGAASCCAIPLLLGALGLGGAWLASLAIVAGPYRPVFLAAASICLVGGGFLLWRRQAAAACSRGATYGRSSVTRATLVILSLATILTALGLVFA
jgi:mercuric ion transport protein